MISHNGEVINTILQYSLHFTLLIYEDSQADREEKLILWQTFSDLTRSTSPAAASSLYDDDEDDDDDDGGNKGENWGELAIICCCTPGYNDPV